MNPKFDTSRLKWPMRARGNILLAKLNEAALHAISTSSRQIIPWTEIEKVASMGQDGFHYDDRTLDFCSEVIMLFPKSFFTITDNQVHFRSSFESPAGFESKSQTVREQCSDEDHQGVLEDH